MKKRMIGLFLTLGMGLPALAAEVGRAKLDDKLSLGEKDIVALDFVGGETKISLNGEARGGIAGERFNSALMRVWLGDQPVQSDLKKALLGG